MTTNPKDTAHMQINTTAASSKAGPHRALRIDATGMRLAGTALAIEWCRQ